MSTIRVERITNEQELSECAEILVSAYNNEPWNDEWTHETALAKLVCFYNSPKFLGWMAYEGNQLVGCCVGNIEPYYTGDYFYLKEMFILHQAQGKGIGAKLMVDIKAHMEAEQIEMMILFTSNAGFPFKFWQKQGFAAMEDMRMMGFGETE